MKMKVMKRYKENGEEIVVMDLSKEFKRFIRKNDKLLRELSKH